MGMLRCKALPNLYVVVMSNTVGTGPPFGGWLSSLDLWQSSSVRLTLIGCSAQWIRTWEAHWACWNTYFHQFSMVSSNFSSLGIYLWEWCKNERKKFLYHDDGLYLRKSWSFWFPFLNDETIATRWCDQLFPPVQLQNTSWALAVVFAVCSRAAFWPRRRNCRFPTPVDVWCQFGRSGLYNIILLWC